MDSFAPLAVWAIIIIIGLGIVGILIFGVRSMVQGKARPLTIGVMAVPIVLFIVLYLVMSPAHAAMWTTIIMFALGLLALLSSGLWGMFT